MNVYGMKRVRPLMGTYFGISIEDANGEAVGPAILAAFATAARLEKLLSKFESGSWPNRFNTWDGRGKLDLPDDLFPLFQMAFEMCEVSGGAFDPFTPGGDLDLTGIAKGWIVDRVAEQLALALPGREICVNAGGDLRFINSVKRPVTLRFSRGLKRLRMVRDAVAVSSITSAHPSTMYHKISKRAVSVAVMHDSCAVADALAKVALFAPNGDEVLARYGARSVVVEAR